MTSFPCKDRIWVNTYICFCPLDHLIMRQCRSRPWGWCTFNFIHIQNLFKMFQYQVLCDIDQILNFVEVRVFVDFRIRQMIRSKMNGCFHWRRHEQSPNQHIGLLLLQLQMLSDPLWIPTHFAYVGKPSSSIDDLRSSCYETLSLCSPPEPVSWCSSSSKIQPALPVSRNLHFECFPVCRLTWEYSLGSRLGFRISFLMPGAPPCSFSTFTRLTGLPKSCGGFFLALNGLCKTRFMHLDFATAEFVGFGFAIGEPSLEVASCPLFHMARCFLIGSERKLLEWLQENIEKFMMFIKRRRLLHSSRMKLIFG